MIDRVDWARALSSIVRARAIEKLLVELDQLVVGNQLALRIDEIVLGPVFLDLALGRVEAGAQLVEPRQQFVGGAAGRVGLQLAISLEEHFDQRVGDQRGLLGVFGGGADRHHERLAAALDRQAFGEVVEGKRPAKVASATAVSE